MICTQCLSEELLRTSGGYLVVGLGAEEEIALVYHPKPQVPEFDEHGLPDLPAPGYIVFEHVICVGCGYTSMWVPEEQRELLAALRRFVREVNDIEQKRYGSEQATEDVEDVPDSGGSEHGD